MFILLVLLLPDPSKSLSAVLKQHCLLPLLPIERIRSGLFANNAFHFKQTAANTGHGGVLHNVWSGRLSNYDIV